MRARKYLICAEWLNLIMIFMLYFLSSEWIYQLLKMETVPVHALMTGLILICSYLSRVYIEKLLLYMGVHCVELFVFLLIPMPVKYKVMCLLTFGIVSICDLFFWTSEGIRSFGMIHPVGVTLMLAGFVYASYNDIPGFAAESYVCGILFLALFFLRTYLLNAVRLAGDMQVNSSTPLSDMLKTNGWMVFFLVFAFTVLMFLVRSDSLARWIKAFMRIVSEFVRRVLIFILSFFEKGAAKKAGIEEMGYIDPDIMQCPVLPVWLVTLVQAVGKVLTVFVLALIGYLILKGIAAFVRLYFVRHGYDIRTREKDDHIDIDEKIKHERRKRTGLILKGRDERERIRRKYKRRVEDLRRRGYTLRRDQTPKERALDVDEVKFNELTEKYEYYRYGKM